MAYTYITFAQAKAQLAAKLHDSSMVYFVDAELEYYITEALRTWQCLTAYWRERASLVTISGTAFYDIPTNCSIRSYNVLDQDIVSQIQNHL